MDDLEVTVRGAFERWNSGDRDYGAEELHPEFEIVSLLSSVASEP